jgi:hypothetical protein
VTLILVCAGVIQWCVIKVLITGMLLQKIHKLDRVTFIEIHNIYPL